MARVADRARRSVILQAARAVFQERGYADARMAEIALRAGIAAGTLYLYFPSKEALAQSLGDDYLVRFTDMLVPYLSLPNARAAIAGSVRAALDFAIRERDLLRFVRFSLGPDRIFGRSSAEQVLHETIAQALAGRMAEGELARFDPEALADLLSGLMQWMAEQVLIDGERSAARYEQVLVRLLQNALLPTPAPRAIKLAKRNRARATAARPM